MEASKPLFRWDVLGLRPHIVSLILPCILNGIYFAIALRAPIPLRNMVFAFRHRVPQLRDAASGSFSIEPVVVSTDAPNPAAGPAIGFALDPEVPAWHTVFVRLMSDDVLLVNHPGWYDVLSVEGEQEEHIGAFCVFIADAGPMTETRRAAIRANPLSSKSVRCHFSCKRCPSEIKVYAAVDRSSVAEQDGWSWYEDIPDQFKCGCGLTVIDLRPARSNLHGLLDGGDVHRDVEFLPLYTKNSLSALVHDFSQLLASKPAEEIVQKFIERNPVLLHQFPGDELFFKPPILTKYKADFAVLTPQKELILVEIERPDLRLVKRDGHIHAELNHAIGQVQDWLQVFDDHKFACLESMGLGRANVAKVRGVVIAGRDAGSSDDENRRLKAREVGNRISFLTYDDLLGGLRSLILRLT
jgi:hypothetical protein